MSSSTDKQEAASAWYGRYRSLRVKLALIAGGLALLFGAVMWFGKKVLSVAPASGIPLGECVRTADHIASLLQATDPHLPEISGRGGNTTTSVSILLIPLDGSAPKKIPIAEGLTSNQFALAKILGTDGRVLWFDVNGIGCVDLERMKLLAPAEVRAPYVPTSARPFAISPDTYLAAGFIVAPGQWLGLHSEEERLGEFAPKKFVRRVAAQGNRKQMRRFHRGELAAPVDEKHHRISSMMPLGTEEYFNAAFLRLDDKSEAFRLADPDGALMICTSEPGLKGTTVVARVDTQGRIIWKADTGIDRFKLTQILPGKASFAFVGTRPSEEGKVPEPLVVIVDNVTGETATCSLWR